MSFANSDLTAPLFSWRLDFLVYFHHPLVSSHTRVERLDLDLTFLTYRNCLKTYPAISVPSQRRPSLIVFLGLAVSASVLPLISVLLWQPCRFTSGVLNQRESMMVIYWNGRPGGLISHFKKCHECRPLTKRLIMYHIWQHCGCVAVQQKVLSSEHHLLRQQVGRCKPSNTTSSKSLPDACFFFWYIIKM